MPQLQNTEYKVPIGSAWTFAARVISEKTLLDLVQADVYEISEVITDTTTGTQATRTLDKADVVFDTLQTTQLIASAQYQHNVRVSVPPTKITQKRRYTYQLVITHDNGSESADSDYIQKTDEIDVYGD